jgi:predicted hydrolase (HD superfamily)
MTRDDAEELLKKYVTNERMLDHSFAAEAVLRSLARRLGRDEEKWGLAGLLHDPEIIDAVKMHNEAVCGTARHTEFQHALAAGETVTGLVVATALVYPDKKIAGVKVKSITKRMKERAFAASVNRETIRECEKIGLSLDEFVGIALAAMQGIAGRLGL